MTADDVAAYEEQGVTRLIVSVMADDPRHERHYLSEFAERLSDQFVRRHQPGDDVPSG